MSCTIEKFVVIPYMIAVLMSTSAPIIAYQYRFLKNGQIVKVAA